MQNNKTRLQTILYIYTYTYIYKYTYAYIYNIYICAHSILYYKYIIVQISVSQSLSLSLPVELCRSSCNSWLVAPKKMSMGIIWHMLKPPGQIVCQRRCPILVHAPQAAWEGRALLLDDSSLSWQAPFQGEFRKEKGSKPLNQHPAKNCNFH